MDTHRKSLSDRTPLAQPLRSTIHEGVLMKLRSFYTTKDSAVQNGSLKNGKRFFTNYTSNRGLIYKMDKELDIKKNNPIKNWDTWINTEFSI